MKHANKTNYKNILILEDDFQFDKQIKNTKNIKNISQFINNNKFNIYSLGNINSFFIPNFNNLKHNLTIIGTVSHALIFSKEARNIIIHEYYKNKCLKNVPLFKGHDIWFNFILDKRYFYYKPLCYQLIKKTENSNKWNNKLIEVIFKLLKLNTQVQPGWTIIYLLLYLLNLLLFLGIIKILSKLYVFF